ncbi:MAG: peptide ABC transporter substrate-binding protein [Pseudomonadales bacterium]|nr:peptide ABC transporter substrate-binding protein [Pseudomonadales bacterium]
MVEPPATDSESAFAQTAGKQLLVFGGVAFVAIAILMLALQALTNLMASNTTTAQAIDDVNNMISIAIREEPPQLNSTVATDASSGMIIGHVFEGLLRMNAKDQLEAGIAHKWHVTDTQVHFWLRTDARWSDGSTITAQDFVFGWQTALSPEVASEYAFLLFHIKNGRAINAGELPASELGVSTPNDFELIVQLERPVAFFDKMVTFPTYLPVPQKFYQATAGKYGADASELLYSGPYTISNWVHGSSLLLEKNEHYWDKDRIAIDKINIAYITSDSTASLNFFKDDKIATTTLTAENLDSALEERWQIKKHQDGAIFFLEFNHRKSHITQNYNLRRSMQLVLDMEELVYKVTKLPGYLPGESLFPEFLMGVETHFRKEYPATKNVLDRVRAREHIKLAKHELGLEAIPPLMLLTGDNAVSNIQAEWVQASLKKHLDLDIRIDKQIFKQRLAKMTAGEFDMVLAGWGPDYDDPLTFGDLFASWNLNNRGRYASDAMDGFISQVQDSVDPATRMRLFAQIQQLVYDDVVILPMYERGVTYVVHPRLKGMKRRVIGPQVDFTNAYIEPVSVN